MIKEKLSSLTPKVYTVQVEWDGDSKMWVAYSDDIPGLATEAPDPDTLKTRIIDLATDILGDAVSDSPAGLLAVQSKTMYLPIEGSAVCA